MRKLLLAFSTLFFCVSASALEVPEKPARYVNDFASMMSASAREALERTLAQFDKETSNQLVVATFDSLQGDSLEDFSIKLAEKWKPGTEKKDNGVILLIFKQDRAVRIEVGYGLEGALPDAVAKRIIENVIVPSFKAGDFDAGILNAAQALIAATRGEYTGESAEDFREKYGHAAFIFLVLYMLLPLICYAGVMIFMTWVFGVPGFIAGAVVVVLLMGLRKILAGHMGQSISSKGGGWYSSGGGGWGGGSFGGFGGGGFGGGGASGRW